MRNIKIIKGDLIELAIKGDFDVIAHGCNCFKTMGAGIAVQFKNIFGADFHDNYYIHDLPFNIEALGNIDSFNPSYEFKIQGDKRYNNIPEKLIVVNAYTQYRYGTNIKQLDYEALTLCLRKINYNFKTRHVGLPWIGCGLAGGNKERVLEIIKNELKDCKVTIVEYEKKTI